MESFKPMFRMLWGAIALLVALKIFFLWWNSPRRKGARGEALMARRLREGLPAGYLVLNDVYLPLADGTTTQIDHVVVSQFGIFVVETKTYAGWIFGDERSAQWTQTIYRKKSRFQNPLRQNYRHICALADNLGIDRSYFQSVIAFTGACRFRSEMPANVVYSKDAAKYIRSVDTPRIKPCQVAEIASAIGEWQLTVGDEQKGRHVENLRRRHSPVKSGERPRCPFCGGEMVRRERKSDGRPFYGCKRYPACRGVLDME
ncbi:MAG: NERD domain-containing protein [Kiritimatiellae bacterium]|nr:NERD domain-containing protein [Kiritimatiellia bacterium]